MKEQRTRPTFCWLSQLTEQTLWSFAVTRPKSDAGNDFENRVRQTKSSKYRDSKWVRDMRDSTQQGSERKHGGLRASDNEIEQPAQGRAEWPLRQRHNYPGIAIYLSGWRGEAAKPADVVP